VTVNHLTILGLCAAVGTTGAWLPQIVKTVRSRTARDFSWAYLAMFTSGVLLWIVYGALRNYLAVLVANIVALILIVGVMLVKAAER